MAGITELQSGSSENYEWRHQDYIHILYSLCFYLVHKGPVGTTNLCILQKKKSWDIAVITISQTQICKHLSVCQRLHWVQLEYIVLSGDWINKVKFTFTATLETYRICASHTMKGLSCIMITGLKRAISSSTATAEVASVVSLPSGAHLSIRNIPLFLPRWLYLIRPHNRTINSSPHWRSNKVLSKARRVPLNSHSRCRPTPSPH